MLILSVKQASLFILNAFIEGVGFALNMVQESNFEVRGEFAGFVRDERGKRRLLLRAGEEEFHFKLPGELREQFGELLVPGHAIIVSGVEQRDRFSGWIKRIVSRLQFLEKTQPGIVVCSHCPIRVCAKKNCWKNGGKELWQALEHKIASAGLKGVIKLKAVGCLDHCKCAPNLACGDTHLEQCTSRMADDLVARLAHERR